MSWTLKLRGDSTAPILADYECPVHGRFEKAVNRDENGDPPEVVTCLHESVCDCSSPGCVNVDVCCLEAPFRFPTPVGRVKPGEVAKGKVMDYPPENVCLDTRALADDPSPSGYSKWRDKQKAITRDEGLKRARSGRR